MDGIGTMTKGSLKDLTILRSRQIGVWKITTQLTMTNIADKRKEELQGAASWMERSAGQSVRWRVESLAEASYLSDLLQSAGDVTRENRGSYYEVALIRN